MSSRLQILKSDMQSRFRHLFRHLYRYHLETEGVRQALKQAQRLQAVYRENLGQFIAFLDQLNQAEG
ncbi:MAG: hypothetical protein JW953_06500 [Anaerolineae bacterium]|nr:hypothetical protein [Anaerolineae bacterium]